jgi:hypothetical protein
VGYPRVAALTHDCGSPTAVVNIIDPAIGMEQATSSYF